MDAVLKLHTVTCMQAKYTSKCIECFMGNKCARYKLFTEKADILIFYINYKTRFIQSTSVFIDCFHRNFQANKYTDNTCNQTFTYTRTN